jgi:hypothetical protein
MASTIQINQHNEHSVILELNPLHFIDGLSLFSDSKTSQSNLG